MDEHRRKTLKWSLAATLMTLAPGAASHCRAAAPDEAFSSVNIIIPRTYVPPITGSQGDKYKYSLVRATLDYIEEHYSRRNLPVWNRPLDRVDIEKRLYNIIYWISEGISEHRKVYPVDPAWIIAQIMAESFFYEFAASYALAVGVCQFVPATARRYDMICAGDRPEHHKPPYKLTEMAGKVDEYYQLRDKKNQARRAYSNGKSTQAHLIEALEALVNGGRKSDAQHLLEWMKLEDEYREQYRQASKDYRRYLAANFEGRNIFNRKDVEFLRTFDERATYRKPVKSMVLMMAQGLKARNGNIIAATAAYNAGLNRTQDSGPYSAYGKLPDFEQTVTYVSHIFINHHEILKRM